MNWNWLWVLIGYTACSTLFALAMVGFWLVRKILGVMRKGL